MLNCSEARLKLEPCASGTLSAEDKIALEEHLATCEGCRLELELTKAVLGAPTFEGVDEPPPNAPHPLPMSGSSDSTPGFPASVGVDEEVSFADLALDSLESTSTSAAPPVSQAESAGPTPPGQPASSAAAAPADANTALWDFEPVDAPRDAGPPEGSLSFAHEALRRKNDDEQRRKATLVRLALWGGGVGCGLALLGISVWIALAFRQGQPDPPRTYAPSTPAPIDQVAPDGTPLPGMTTTPDAGAGVAPTAGAGVTPGPATTVPGMTPPGTTTPPAPTPTPDAGATGDRGEQVPPTPGDTEPRPAAAKPKPKSPPKASAKPSPKAAPQDMEATDQGTEAPEWSPSDLQAPPPKPSPKASERNPGGSPAQAPSPAPDTESGPAVTPAPTGQESPPAPATQKPSAESAPPASPAPAPKGGAATAPPPAAPVVTRPIDRLHLATVNATENQDLVTLRKLRESWKSFLRSAAGPDRVRSKRELADCLWAIQEMTAKVADRREALAAYRDYVLNAPAGGPDSRSINRMRYLEDSLSESY